LSSHKIKYGPKEHHLYSTLAAVTGEGRAEVAQGASRGGTGHERRQQEKNDRRKELVTVVYKENLIATKG
jgi:hypothetical protein